MKRFLTSATSVLVMLSLAAPAFALGTTGTERLSRRLVRSTAILNQRVPSGAMPVAELLRQRREAQADTTGRSQLSRAHLRAAGQTTKFREGFPSRRTIRQLTEDQGLLVLPPALVETGGMRTRVNRLSRRSLVVKTRRTNRIEVAPLENAVPAPVETPAATETE